jgi:hypothetical protein
MINKNEDELAALICCFSSSLFIKK